jgi:hypothetical protein
MAGWAEHGIVRDNPGVDRVAEREELRRTFDAVAESYIRLLETFSANIMMEPWRRDRL